MTDSSTDLIEGHLAHGKITYAIRIAAELEDVAAREMYFDRIALQQEKLFSKQYRSKRSAADKNSQPRTRRRCINTE
jgi:hypothetical protein